MKERKLRKPSMTKCIWSKMLQMSSCTWSSLDNPDYLKRSSWFSRKTTNAFKRNSRNEVKKAFYDKVYMKYNVANEFLYME